MMPHHVRAQGHEELETWRVDRPPLPTFGPSAPHDWRKALPTLATPLCTLRELKVEDAASLCRLLTTEEVSRFISPPPTSVEAFESFIRWAHEQRAKGRYACFAVVPAGETEAIGLFQVCLRDPNATSAEWGFVLGSKYWGTGIFIEGARRVMEFVFGQLGLTLLEARAVPQNGRGTGALRKIGAEKVGVLRGSLERFGERLDQAVWIVTRQNWWLALRRKWCETVH
jgi:ribosomal-protein-alanine N-acetyltransferase